DGAAASGTGSSGAAAGGGSSPPAGASSAAGGRQGGTATGSPTGSPSAGAGSSAASVRGVTPTTVKIGVALLDLGALRNLGPAFDNGNRQAHFDSILAGWKRAGLLPVAGRTVEFVYRSYNIV